MKTLSCLALPLMFVVVAIMSAEAPVPTKTAAQAAKRDQARAGGHNLKLKQTLMDLEKHSWQAWQKRDGAFFQRFLSDDHVEVGFGGWTDKATVVKGVASPTCVVKSYTLDRFELTAFSDHTALLNYYAAQETTCNGVRVPSPVWVSSLYVSRDGRWVNALYQQTQAIRPSQ